MQHPERHSCLLPAISVAIISASRKKSCARVSMASVATGEPTVISRLDRLDMMLGYLDEMRGSRTTTAAVRCSGASTDSSRTATSDGGNSSVNSSPKGLERRRRPIDEAVVEAQLKGTLIDRVHHLEIRLLKLEEEIETEKRKEEEERSPRSGERKSRGRGLKSLVKSCVKGNLKTKE